MRGGFGWLKREGILSDTAEHSGRAHGIDALRGFFALWVLMAHLVPWTQHYLGDGSVWAPVATIFEYLGQISRQTARLIRPSLALSC